MSERPPEETPVQPAVLESEEDYTLSADLVFAVDEALEAGAPDKALDLIRDLHEADQADLLESLGRDHRQALVEALGVDFDPEVLPNLVASVREEVIDLLGPERLARLLSALHSDDAVEVFEDLDEEFQHRILTALPHAYRHILEASLSYPEDSAGRLMQREVVVIPSAWTIGETIDYMRASEDLPDDFYDLYIVNPKHHPMGYFPLSRALRTRRPVRLTEIMEPDMKVIPLTMDQEEVAYLFRQYGLVSAPVVDDAGRLVGVITVDDVVHIIEQEAEEDIMHLAGVSEVDLYSALLDTTRARFPWLVVNLLTAIVASMGGNAGTQTLAVAVRALAMKDLTEANAARFIGKEFLVGAANGVLFAVFAGLVAWLWFDSPEIGAVIAVAMAVNMVVAGLSGTLIPLGLVRVGVDPAIASSVCLTTVTDVVGFLAFLGLAAAFLL